MSYLRANVNVAIIREQIITRLMPDTCRLQPSRGTSRSIEGAGYVVETPATFKTYNASPDIPCRYDAARAFRPDDINVQTSVVNEYNLQLPFDADVDEDDIVYLNYGTPSERRFEIRKVKDASEWDYTIEASIFEISTEVDL